MDRTTAVAVGLAVALALAGCTADLTGAPARPDGELRATVTEVVDGDTVEVRYENGTIDTVRLVGVDTPETHVENDPREYGVPDTVAGRDCLRRWGERATAFATERLDGRQVTLSLDPNLDTRGYYGRLLAYVRVADRNRTFNYRLVARGYARVYDSDFTRKDRYLAAEADARRDGTRLWECASDDGVPTATGPATPTRTGDTGTEASTGTPVTDGDGPLAVVEVHADAEGDDRENLNDEYVTLENAGNASLDLENWTVRDAADHVYTFGAVTLDPGERVTLHTGSGEDADRHVYWGRSAPVWNNDGDTVTVRDTDGDLVVRHRY